MPVTIANRLSAVLLAALVVVASWQSTLGTAQATPLAQPAACTAIVA